MRRTRARKEEGNEGGRDKEHLEEQEQEEQEEKPTPKSIRRGSARRLKFNT